MFSSSAVQRPLSLLVRVHYGKDVGLKIEILVGSKVSVQLRRQSKNNFDNLIRKKNDCNSELYAFGQTFLSIINPKAINTHTHTLTSKSYK